MTTKDMVIAGQELQVIKDQNTICDVQIELLKSDVEPKLKVEINDWLNKAYKNLETLNVKI